MKKTLLALAAMAAASASFAQSSVTLYGVVDASLESVKGDKTVTRVSSDNLSSSRLGFKGTEDIGGGLKANFVLETNVKPDTGTQGQSNRFWDRAAWVGLAGGFGDLRLGRIDTPIGDVAGNVLSAQAYDDLKIVGTRAGNDYRRADNAITYFLPTLVPGLTASLQYTTGNGTAGAGNGETAGSNVGKAYGLSVKYAAGPLSAGLGYENMKDESAATAGDQKANATLVYAGYDFGAAKVTGYYDAETNTANTAGLRRLTVLGAKVAVPFTPEFTLIAGLSTARNVNGAVAGDDNVQITTVKGIYNLSKRTSVYGMLTNVNNDTNTKKGVLAPTVNDKTTRGIAAGIRHTF
ncbi:MAG TPA: porin [Aquabacterium sp.]|uniref:porin n=1 Tax=Aquabacterium sp. TaxID=1872578 RepID=UPI002E34137C|nr:porin [Aquabacterium sp.]HEX5354944.1 porin [Aquabacterium sp.]